MSKVYTKSPSGEPVEIKTMIPYSQGPDVDIVSEILYNGATLLNPDPNAIPTVGAVFNFVQDLFGGLIEPIGTQGTSVISKAINEKVIPITEDTYEVQIKSILGLPFIDENNALNFKK